jgi:hypothetical protein
LTIIIESTQLSLLVMDDLVVHQAEYNTDAQFDYNFIPFFFTLAVVDLYCLNCVSPIFSNYKLSFFFEDDKNQSSS